MNSDNICPQFLNNDSVSQISSDKKEVHSILEATKQHLSAEVIREEGSLVSNSTTNSVMQNQSNATSSHGDDDESCPSPSSEKKKESLEDSKPNETPSAWGKPLKKVTKVEENAAIIGGTNTAVIKVVKPGPPPQKDLRQAFYDAWRGYDRNAPRQLYKSSLTILPSKKVNSQKIEKEPLLPQSDVYKEALTKDEITERQLYNELSKKLCCSVGGTSIFESAKLNLGYPVYLEKDIFKRLRPVPIMKLLSYKAFFNSSSRVEGDHWIPAYINEDHFKRNYDDILDAIALIYQDIEEKDDPENFQPLMVLKVLPTLLVKNTIHFSKRNITQSKDSIDTFCQLYRLFVKLVELFPEIKEAIDQEVKGFISSESNRHQRVQEDLGEFLIKLSVSSDGLNSLDTINLVLQEHLARQALFCLKRERDLGKGQHECDKFLKTYMDAIRMSNEVFLSTVEMCRLFADNDVNSELEARYGVLNKAMRRVFLDRLSWIRRNVGHDWEALIEMLQLKSRVGNEQVMASYVVKSFETAKANGYLD